MGRKRLARHWYPYQIGRQIVRDVWAIVTRDPQVSIRDCARQTGHSSASVNAALYRLRELGYIDFESGRNRTRTIVMLYGEIGATNATAATPGTR